LNKKFNFYRTFNKLEVNKRLFYLNLLISKKPFSFSICNIFRNATKFPIKFLLNLNSNLSINFSQSPVSSTFNFLKRLKKHIWTTGAKPFKIIKKSTPTYISKVELFYLAKHKSVINYNFFFCYLNLLFNNFMYYNFFKKNYVKNILKKKLKKIIFFRKIDKTPLKITSKKSINFRSFLFKNNNFRNIIDTNNKLYNFNTSSKYLKYSLKKKLFYYTIYSKHTLKKKLKKLKTKLMEIKFAEILISLIPSIKFIVYLYDIKNIIKKPSYKIKLENFMIRGHKAGLSKGIRKILKKGKFSTAKLIKLVG
jgi:hypothetical protein